MRMEALHLVEIKPGEYLGPMRPIVQLFTWCSQEQEHVEFSGGSAESWRGKWLILTARAERTPPNTGIMSNQHVNIIEITTAEWYVVCPLLFLWSIFSKSSWRNSECL